MQQKTGRVKAYSRRSILGLFVSLALVAILVLPALATDSTVPLCAGSGRLPALASTAWPMFQHDQGHTGRSPYLGTQTNVLRWAYDTDSQFRGSAAIGSDGTIYINSYNSNCKLYAFNPDGSVKWASPTDSVDGAPAISSDGTIYVASTWGLYAYNPDGTRKWFCSALSLNGSPVIGNDGTIYCGQSGSGGAGLLYAFSDHGSYGSVKWTYNTGQLLHTAPAIGNDGTIYIGGIYNTLFALTDKGASAELKWTFATSGSLRSSPPSIGSDGTIYIGSDYGYVYAITDSGPSAVQKWRFDTAGSVVSAPAIGNDGTIYVGCQGGPHILFALNPDGSPKWDYGSGDIASSSPAIGNDGTIYIGDVYGKVYAVFDDTVRRIAVLKWEYTAGDSIYGSAAIGSDGTVYIGSYDSKFYAFNDRPYVPPPKSASIATNLGMVNFSVDAGSISGLTHVRVADTRCSTPAGYDFPYGLFSFNISSLKAGQTVRVTIKFPRMLPLNVKYYKCINSKMVDCNRIMTRLNDYTLALDITDGGFGDADGLANCTIVDPGGPVEPVAATTVIGQGTMAITQQSPVALPSISVKSASLSASRVGPGTPVTVTANVANTGTVNGTSSIKVYVNGEVETSQGVTVSSGSDTPVTFTVSRNEPGTYSVYVGGTNAGSFTVDALADPNIILYISGALLVFAFVIGALFIVRRRQPGH